MEKAYDLKDLVKRLGDTGIPALMNLAEDEALMGFKVTKEWLKESAILSENKIDDVVMPFVDFTDSAILPLIDKIDGQVG